MHRRANIYIYIYIYTYMRVGQWVHGFFLFF
ncbi:unnamed protein product [Spirodela intermedia]|uniref:Uncharacterized protein n=1 Tax=Spirodela intermedia TaxID=51605 RepID=A0A7I8JU73_SPIIN|nr:unnamed protein product [Spirodela intermedia]CAA6673736.1 unnamed protein product [Spirodela intermedia]